MMPGDVHVMPCDDLMEHWQLRQCWCRPRVEEPADVISAAVVIHNSADGREYFEPVITTTMATERQS